MRREDVLVEVRDLTLERKGTITSKYLKLTATVRHNNVGEWSLTLPGQHPMVPLLSTPGSGILVSLYGETKFSGPTSNPKRKADRKNPDGTFTFTGVTDDILLADARAWPQPGNGDVSSQTKANDTRTADAETLMRAYVDANIGPSAPASRRGLLASRLALAANQGRGRLVSKSPRFQNLMELLTEIATLAGLGFQVVQRGSELMFEVLDLADRSDLVRLDIQNGTLTSEEIEKSPPSLTRALVAGQGEGAARTIIERTTPESEEAEAEWGRVIESFIDQRDTDDMTELEQSGDEALIDGGFTATNVKVIPADNQTMQYAKDWAEGDIVAVIVNGQETKTTVTAASMIVSDEAVAVGAAIGDVVGFDEQAALTKRVDDLGKRTEKIERTVEKGDLAIKFSDIQERPTSYPSSWDDVSSKPGTFPSTWDQVAEKPSTFPPSAHKHPFTDLGPLAQLGGSVNLDTLTSNGEYYQASNANAASGSNYPIDAAGHLLVRATTDGSFVQQWYTSYKDIPGSFWRGKYGGSWGPWKRNGSTEFEDTDWIKIPLRDGFVANGASTPYIMRLNGVLHLEGLVKKSSGSFTSGVQQFGDLPTGYGFEACVANNWRYLPLAAGSGIDGYFVIMTDGTIRADIYGTAAWLSLAMSFPQKQAPAN